MAPPFGPHFRSAWFKWGWAIRHANAFQAEIELFTSKANSQPVFTTRVEYHPKRHAMILLVDTIRAVPPHWGLYLGDITFNFRSCLDHVAWAVVSRGTSAPSTLTGKQQTGISFPLARDARHFRELVRLKQRGGSLPAPRKPDGKLGNLPGALTRDITIIRRFQPYHIDHRRKGGEQALFTLARLNNHDKHRELQPTLTVPIRGTFTCSNVVDCVITEQRIRARAPAFHVNAEIGTLRVRKTGPNPDMDIDPDISTEIALGNRVTFKTWYETTAAWIAELLNKFSEPPSELDSWGLKLPF